MSIGKNTDTTDLYLWNKLRYGDAHALEIIFDLHIRLLYSYGHKFTNNRSLVEDCIQDLFAEIWEKHAKLSETNSIRFYLFKSLRRKIIRNLQKSHHYVNDLEEAGELSVVSHEYALILQQFSEEQLQLLQDALQKLTKRQKEAIFLKFYNQLTYEQIAEVMDLNKRTVYNLISLALDTLQKELASSQKMFLDPVWLPLIFAFIFS